MAKRGNRKRRRLTWLAAGAGLALGLAAAANLPDLNRYRKIRKM
jgi:hypothetical protein